MRWPKGWPPRGCAWPASSSPTCGAGAPRGGSGRRTGSRSSSTPGAVIAELGGAGPLVIGGKSMGGRMASKIADEAGARGLVCLGYPFHPPGKPERTRTDHLEHLRTPTLIVQGTRDAFGTPEDVAGYTLSPAIRLVWLEDGDHSFKPRAASGRTERQKLQEAVAAVAELVKSLAA